MNTHLKILLSMSMIDKQDHNSIVRTHQPPPPPCPPVYGLTFSKMMEMGGGWKIFARKGG